jgi:response regulator RpfG family c-di-GMP phosphodiesterase
VALVDEEWDGVERRGGGRRDDDHYSLEARKRFHRSVALSIIILYLASIAGFWQVERIASSDRKQNHAQHVRDDFDRQERRAALNATLGREANLAKVAYVATCERQNSARKAIRAGIVQNNDAIGQLLVQVTPTDRQAQALKFAAQLHDVGVATAKNAAPKVDCSYPPKTEGGG